MEMMIMLNFYVWLVENMEPVNLIAKNRNQLIVLRYNLIVLKFFILLFSIKIVYHMYIFIILSNNYITFLFNLYFIITLTLYY